MYEPSHYRQPSTYQQSGGGAGWIVVLCILWTIFAPVPGAIDDLVVWAFGADAAHHGRRWQVHVASAFPLAHHYRAAFG